MEDSQESIKVDILEKKCILVVEDDPILLQMLKGVIEEEGGHQVILAANGFQALNLIRSTKPDLFLFDYHLPGMDGIDLYHLVHVDRAYAHIPVLFLTANASETVFEQEHLDFLRKPFDIEDLLLQIEELLTG